MSLKASYQIGNHLLKAAKNISTGPIIYAFSKQTDQRNDSCFNYQKPHFSYKPQMGQACHIQNLHAYPLKGKNLYGTSIPHHSYVCHKNKPPLIYHIIFISSITTVTMTCVRNYHLILFRIGPSITFVYVITILENIEIFGMLFLNRHMNDLVRQYHLKFFFFFFFL